MPLNKVPRHNSATPWMNIPMKHLDISYIHAATEDDYKFYGNLNVVFDGVVFYKTTSSNNMYLKVK